MAAAVAEYGKSRPLKGWESFDNIRKAGLVGPKQQGKQINGNWTRDFVGHVSVGHVPAPLVNSSPC